ncbi:MAG TPA: DUF2298 domain-containing protein [Thermoanaerobaculia bacterium]|nr:DUF2298 domain-containing protein [Thermoanaerobaculia bacterium]
MSRLLLLGILVVAGALRFYRLDWNDHAWPHPDERAVVSQTYDMMVRGDYRPTIHTWGHAGYYSTLFAYKAYLWLQQGWSGAEDVERLAPADDSAVPAFREIVHGGGAIPLGLLVVLAVWIGFDAGRRLLARSRWAALAAGAGALAIALALPWIRDRMLVPVAPNFDDVALVGRFLSALASTLTVALVYSIGARLYRPAVGLLAAAFLAVAVVPIQLARFFIVDPLQAFAVVLAMWLAVLLQGTRLRDPATAGVAVPAGDAPPRPLAADLLRRLAAVPWPALALYVLLGGAIGLAMASKFSSAPLFALPLVAHLLLLRRVRLASTLALHVGLVLAYLAALGAWFALHPYAWENAFTPFAAAAAMNETSRQWLHILFSREFADQIFEQSQMVDGRAGGPWVQQFADTTPWLTLTVQMVRFSLGWPLGLVCVAGLGWVVLSNLRRPRAADLLLLSWAGVLFVILGSFQATFTRYTAPLIPFLCLFGALLCLGRDRPEASLERLTPLGSTRAARLGRAARHAGVAAAIAALVGGLLYSLAFVRIYRQPHAWTYASLWIFKNVAPARPDGAPTRIAHEEWDDTIPLHMPPHDAGAYGSIAMAPYHGDGEEKLRRLAAWLEEADWICLPTTRLYGTILTVPERYPITADYYRALFAGRLGFTLRRTVRYPPRLFGVVVDDLAADESHHVYDHPKAVLFEKTERLGRDELERRIRDLPPEVAALEREHLLRWSESPREQLLNVARDPYLEGAAIAEEELAALVRSAGIEDGEAAAFLAAAAKRGASLRAVPSAEVRAAVESASATLDAAALASARERIQSLETRVAYRAGDLRKIAEATVVERAARERLVRWLLYTVDGGLLPRREVLRKLAAVALDAPSPLDETARAIGARRPPRGNQVRVATAGGGGQIVTALGWLLALELLGLAVLPWSLRVFSALPDAGIALAKTLGWIVATWVAWLAGNVPWIGLGPVVAWLALAAVGAAAWAPPAARRGLGAALPPWRVVIASEALFVVTFAAFAAVRAFNPEIYWGEKTMDFSFLNAVLRGGSFPPYEPWFAGTVLNYYYFGFVLVAYLAVLLGTPTALAFNLAMAILPALTVAAAFSIAYAMTRKIRWGVVGGSLVGFLGNLDVLHQLWRTGALAALVREEVTVPVREHGPLLGAVLAGVKLPVAALRALVGSPGERSLWDSWWATSRALGEGMINEFPVWSWLFADLHAHVLVMPVSLLVLGLVYAAFLDHCDGQARPLVARAGVYAALALALGAQLATNAWDFMAYTGLLAVMLVAAAAGRPSADASRPTAIPAAASVEPASAPGTSSGHVSLIVFVVAWTALWPMVRAIHPYWLGLGSDWWIGGALAVALVALSRAGAGAVSALESAVTTVAAIARRSLLPAALVLAAAIALYYPFHAHLDTGGAGLRGNRDGFITALHALRHFGFFAIATAAWLLAALTRRIEQGPRQRLRLLWWGAAGACGMAILVVSGALREASGLVLYAVLSAAVLTLGWDRTTELAQRFPALLLGSGWGLAAVSETVVLTDRMNTVFKLYHPAWMFLALGTVGTLAPLLDGWDRFLTRRPAASDAPDPAAARPGASRLRPVAAVLTALLAAALVVAAVSTWRGIKAVTTLERKVSARPTLDGLDFLRHTDEEAELREAIDWLNAHTRGPEVVAEAFTDRGYDDSARIAKYTGLPIVLGWPHHVKQRGRTPEQLALRQADLVRLYGSADAAEVARICRRYDVRYILMGDLEAQVYRVPRSRFDGIAGVRSVFRSRTGRYAIYAVEPGEPVRTILTSEAP